MASVSGATSSLGNTSLRGFGGFASGIDRDAMIEQMTAGTTAKINNHKNKITATGWKQEAFQSVSDKILALQDDYLSYASGSNLKDPSFFAKNQITAMGHEDVTKFVSATGSSNMLDYLSILGVKQLATRSSLVSGSKGTSSIKTNITEGSMTDSVYKGSNLQGRRLYFGTYDTVDEKFSMSAMFEFTSYYMDTDADGKEVRVDIDYTVELDSIVDPATGKTGGEQLAEQLNKALEKSGLKDGDNKFSDVMEFAYDKTTGIMQLKNKGSGTNLQIYADSTALSALGYNSESADGTAKNTKDGISLSELADNQKKFDDTYVNRKNMIEYMAGKKIDVTYGGQTKSLELIKASDFDKFYQKDADGNYLLGPDGEKILTADAFGELETLIQDRLDHAFGTNNIDVSVGASGLEFQADAGQTLVINSDYAEVRNVLGITKGASNKLSVSSSIAENIDKLVPERSGESAADTQARRDAFLADLQTNGLVINGVKIEGVTENTTLEDMMNKINANKDVGVKASFLSGTNQLVLTSSETGSGRQIKTEGASAAIFGEAQPGTSGPSSDGSKFNSGQNAQILISYGSGAETMIESTSNTFQLEGLNITVSSEFGDVQGTNGAWTSDRSKAVTFSAKADAEGVTESVKKLVESFNELVKEINSQVRTKPDKSYGPLSEAQKEEMSEKSIENWEKKAKEGLLYNDATMRSLSMDMQSIMTNLMASGASYEDLKEIGFTFSEDYFDGGTIVFDEAKFKAAMTNDPEKVSNIFVGGGDVTKGFAKILEETTSVYATRFSTKNGGSYGRLIEEAGSEKIPSSITKNQIYDQLQEMQKYLDTLNTRLQKEQDRYISQFTVMETMINQMNSQSSYLAQFQA